MIFGKENIIKIILLVIMLTVAGIQAFAQQTTELAEGAVSYITGQNIYVKFINTEGIKSGDTLFIKSNNTLLPALLVQHLSSISCLCQPLGNLIFKVSDSVVAKKKQVIKELQTSENMTEKTPEKDVSTAVIASATKTENQAEKQQLITGRATLSSYSNFSTLGETSNKLRYTLVTNIGNQGQERLSAETYISFTHKINEWEKVQENLNNALKIYSLALRYDFSEKASLWAGRKINPSLANVGAIDGIQFEYHPGKFFAGAAAGTRPDYADYSLNTSLFEYGFYAGHNTKSKNGYLQSSLALFEQKNSGNTDRRFLYFQHNNSVTKNLNIFFSCELDLYKVVDSIPKNDLSLTGLYISARYRITPRLSVFASYDNRRNVIYYETFRNYVDELINQASRQGYRMNINYRPVNAVMLGINGGYRFMKTDPEPTKTLNGFGTWSNIPVIKLSVTLSADLIQTSYLNGQVFGVQFLNDFFNYKLQSTLSYRFTNFDYTNSLTTLMQHIAGADLSYQMNKKTYLSANYEFTMQKDQNYSRLYLNLRRKF
jgi:hypothetical protein